MLDFDHPPADPVVLLQRWIDEAADVGLPNPNAMALATCGLATTDGGVQGGRNHGGPSVRMVLLKGLDARGAVFFTNRNSRKGCELRANARAALLFFWDPLNRQARIEGDVTLVSDEESDAYFATRPRESQIGAWASRQSEAARDRGELERAVAEIERRFEGRDVPRPPHWGGYRVGLNTLEFWQGHLFRLHDRLLYIADQSQATGWRTQRLFP